MTDTAGTAGPPAYDWSAPPEWATPSRLIRVEEHQTSNEWVPKLWQSPDARLLIVDATRGVVPVDERGERLRFVAPVEEYDSARHYLLGTVDAVPYFVMLGDPDESVPGPSGTVRQLTVSLDDLDREIAITAVALINWHRNESFCGRCGTTSEVRKAGFMRVCPNCGNEYFPRTDPAVIVAILDDEDRLLLGSQADWGNRVSVFAGFVEAGESAEQAVHREIAEEVGLSLRDIRYYGSQPWPFPRSLMLGFVARAAGTEINIDNAEISYADWFTRDRLARDMADGTIARPSSNSIAFRLITAWRQGRL
ncbi:NAD(+) diphosphatase [Microlunatus elymi]|uniref:NAD(+) diphosphatase n=1 Tax=Microlunatus elymi TaxID=2596828 RepID=UPI00143DE45D|nr:NAD(+) diphosphatase [Microlunatus elymi]